MDMHPAGVPRLVGPAGSEFWPSDFSTQFRFLPNNVTNEILPPHLDSLPIRSHLPTQQLHSTSPNSRFPGAQPLRLREEHVKAVSPRAATSPQHLLPSDHKPWSLLQNPPPAATKWLTHTLSPPDLSPVEIEEVDLPLVADNEGNLQIPEV